MDNLTHTLVGLASAKAGLERLSPGTTALCLLAANSPDSDLIVLAFGDRWDFLHHHRGITHAIVGVVALAIVLPLVFYLVDLLLAKIRGRPKQVKFVGLLIASLIVSATHPLLDWTNNYGVRPFLPWNTQWFYGDLVFIVDPFIWLTLGSACFLLTSKTKLQRLFWIGLGVVLTALIIGSSRGGNLPNPWLIRGLWLVSMSSLVALKGIGEVVTSKIAQVALAVIVLYWCGLGVVHQKALSSGREQAQAIISGNESILRFAAMPTLANPLGWDCVFDTNQATYRFNLRLVGANRVTKLVRYEKPSGALASAWNQVADDRRTRIFLGFARFPVARLSNMHCTSQTLVQFSDLRYTEPGVSRGSFSLDLPVDCPLTNR